MRPIDIFYQAAHKHKNKIAAMECVSGSDINANSIGANKQLCESGQNKKTISYAELLHDVQALACALQHLTAVDKPKIALLTENSIEMLVSTLAIYACQGILIPLTTGYPKQDLLNQIQIAQPDAIIADVNFAEIVEESHVPTIYTTVMTAMNHNKQQSIQALIEKFQQRSPSKAPFHAEQTAAIKFTGGSSGEPKAVLQPARALTAVVSCAQKTYALNEHDRFLLATPMTHGAGTFVLPVLGAGGTLVIIKKVKADYLLRLMQSAAITGFWLPPTLLYRLIDQQKTLNCDLSALRNLIYGGAGLTPNRLKEAANVFGHALGVCYGQTEAPMILTAASSKEAEKVLMGSAGKTSLLSEIAIVDKDGEHLPPGQTGEVIGRGKLLMKGYLNNPKETQVALRNGWLHTGDLGYLDEDGYLYIKGRLKEMIISGGFNIYPAEVEAALASHTHVHECCVFGVADEEWGERVEAAVELKSGKDINPQEIKQFLRTKLGAIRTPKKIHFFNSLPRTSLGKINKQKILRQLRNQTTEL